MKIQKLTNQQKVVLGIVMLGIVWAFFKYLYSPMGKKVNDAKRDLMEKQEKLRITETKALRKDALVKEYELLKAEEKTVEKKLPRQKELPVLLRELNNILKKYKVNFINLLPQASTPREYFIEFPFTINVTANFHNLGLFLTDLGQMDRIINAQNLQITQKQATDQDTTNITASFQIVAYTYKEGS